MCIYIHDTALPVISQLNYFRITLIYKMRQMCVSGLHQIIRIYSNNRLECCAHVYKSCILCLYCLGKQCLVVYSHALEMQLTDW